MGKVRHRKQTRAARVAASAAPLTDTSDPTTNSHPNQHREGKKGQRRDTEMQDLLDKLRAPEGRDRVFAAVRFLPLSCSSSRSRQPTLTPSLARAYSRPCRR